MKKIITALLPHKDSPRRDAPETADLEQAESIRESSRYETYLHQPLGWATAAGETVNNLIGYSSTPLFFVQTLIDVFSPQKESDDNSGMITMYSLIIFFALFIDVAVVIAHYIQNTAENKEPSPSTTDRMQSLQPLANMHPSTSSTLSIQEPLETSPQAYSQRNMILNRTITGGVYVGEIFDLASQPIALAQTIAPNLKDSISLTFQAIMLILGGIVALPATASYHIVVKQYFGGGKDEMPRWINDRLENFTVITKSSTEAISNAMFLTLMGSLFYGKNKPSSLLSFLPITAMGLPFATFFASSNGYAEKLLLHPGETYNPRGFEWKNALIIAGIYLQVTLSLAQNAVNLLLRLAISPIYIPIIFIAAAIAAVRPALKRAMELDMTGPGAANYTNRHNYHVDLKKRTLPTTPDRTRRLRGESMMISANLSSFFSDEPAHGSHSLDSDRSLEHLPLAFHARLAVLPSEENAPLLAQSAPTPHKIGSANILSNSSLSPKFFPASYGTAIPQKNHTGSDEDYSSLELDATTSNTPSPEESGEDSPQFNFDNF